MNLEVFRTMEKNLYSPSASSSSNVKKDSSSGSQGSKKSKTKSKSRTTRGSRKASELSSNAPPSATFSFSSSSSSSSSSSPKSHHRPFFVSNNPAPGTIGTGTTGSSHRLLNYQQQQQQQQQTISSVFFLPTGNTTTPSSPSNSQQYPKDLTSFPGNPEPIVPSSSTVAVAAAAAAAAATQIGSSNSFGPGKQTSNILPDVAQSTAIRQTLVGLQRRIENGQLEGVQLELLDLKECRCIAFCRPQKRRESETFDPALLLRERDHGEISVRVLITFTFKSNDIHKVAVPQFALVPQETSNSPRVKQLCDHLKKAMASLSSKWAPNQAENVLRYVVVQLTSFEIHGAAVLTNVPIKPAEFSRSGSTMFSMDMVDHMQQQQQVHQNTAFNQGSSINGGNQSSLTNKKMLGRTYQSSSSNSTIPSSASSLRGSGYQLHSRKSTSSSTLSSDNTSGSQNRIIQPCPPLSGACFSGPGLLVYFNNGIEDLLRSRDFCKSHSKGKNRESPSNVNVVNASTRDKNNNDNHGDSNINRNSNNTISNTPRNNDGSRNDAKSMRIRNKNNSISNSDQGSRNNRNDSNTRNHDNRRSKNIGDNDHDNRNVGSKRNGDVSSNPRRLDFEVSGRVERETQGQAGTINPIHIPRTFSDLNNLLSATGKKKEMKYSPSYDSLISDSMSAFENRSQDDFSASSSGRDKSGNYTSATQQSQQYPSESSKEIGISEDLIPEDLFDWQLRSSRTEPISPPTIVTPLTSKSIGGSMVEGLPKVDKLEDGAAIAQVHQQEKGPTKCTILDISLLSPVHRFLGRAYRIGLLDENDSKAMNQLTKLEQSQKPSQLFGDKNRNLRDKEHLIDHGAEIIEEEEEDDENDEDDDDDDDCYESLLCWYDDFSDQETQIWDDLPVGMGNLHASRALGRFDLVHSWMTLILVNNMQVADYESKLSSKFTSECGYRSSALPRFWSLHPCGRGFLEKMFLEYSKRRDVQTMAVITCILEEHARTSSWKNTIPLMNPRWKRVCERYLRAYADILHQWGLNNKRAEIMRYVTRDPEEVKSEKDLTFASLCPQCGQASPTALCEKSSCRSKGVHLMCVVCNTSVRGLCTFCPECGHGGHADHMRDWFLYNKECPSGCGCRCGDLEV